MKKRHLVPIILLLITGFFLSLFKHYPQWVEDWYSNGLYVFIAHSLSSISALVPFSLNDVFYFILILYCLTITILIFGKKMKLKTYFRRLGIGIIYVMISFLWLWGFNYYRPNIYERLNLLPLNSPSKDSLFLEVFENLALSAKTNYLPPQFIPNQDSIEQSVEKSYQQWASFLKIPYPCGKGKAKKITLSRLYAQSGILGYYGPWFSELHLNEWLSRWDKPITLAHEKAHRFGIGNEGEANFYAWFICSKSSYQWNRYAASIFALSFFINDVHDNTIKQQLKELIAPKVMQDILARSKYWRDLRQETIEEIGSKINDTYLKTAGVKKGVQDYKQIVDLILRYYNHFKFKTKKKK